MSSPESLNTNKLLFSRIAEGDERAFREFFDVHKQKLYAFTYRLTASADVAEEIVHDVFLKIWSNRAQLNIVNNPADYVFILTRNKTMDYLRKAASDKKKLKQLIAVVQQNEITSSRTAEAEDLMNMHAARRLIDEAVDSLPEQKRIIFHLSKHEGRTHEEIAGHLSISRSRVANAMVEILKYIRSHLEKNTLFIILVAQHFLL